MVKCMFSSFLFGTVLGCLPHCWLWLSLEDILMIRWIWNISILTFCMLPLLLCARRKLKLWILLKSFFSSFCSKLLRCDIFSRWAPYFPEFSLQKKKSGLPVRVCLSRLKIVTWSFVTHLSLCPPPPLLSSSSSCILPLFTGQDTLHASQQHHVSCSIPLLDTFSPFSSVTLI